jgi:DNA-binding cell septation regulator SpoVG
MINNMKLIPVKIKKVYKDDYVLVTFEAIVEVERVVHKKNVIEKNNQYFMEFFDKKEKDTEKFKIDSDTIVEISSND